MVESSKKKEKKADASKVAADLAVEAKVTFMSALFPHISTGDLRESLRATASVEQAIFHVNAVMNPDLSSAAYLVRGKKPAKSNEAGTESQRGVGGTSDHHSFLRCDGANDVVGLTFNDVPSHLFSRMTSLEEATVVTLARHPEYDATVAAFPIDTAAWDDCFISTASMTDVMGARPLTLSAGDYYRLHFPENSHHQHNAADDGGRNGNHTHSSDSGGGVVCEAPIVRWASAAAKEKGGEGRRRGENKEGREKESASRNGRTSSGAVEGTTRGPDTKGASSTAADSDMRSVLPTLLEVCTRMEDELKESIATLEKTGKDMFHGEKSINFCKNVFENCKRLVNTGPEHFLKLLSVLEKEFRGKELVKSVCNIPLPGPFSGFLNLESVSIQELAFDRSRASFSGDGSHVVASVKLKYLRLRPVEFTLRKPNAEASVKKGNIRIKIKDVKLKLKVLMDMLLSGRLNIRCKDVHISIGSLITKCSLLKLHLLIFSLRLCLKRELKSVLSQILHQGLSICIG